MRSRNHNDYLIKIQYSIYEEYDSDGFIEEYTEGPNKTFWLEAKDGSFSRRYSTESAPNWVIKIYNKLCQV